MNTFPSKNPQAIQDVNWQVLLTLRAEAYPQQPGTAPEIVAAATTPLTPGESWPHGSSAGAGGTGGTGGAGASGGGAGGGGQGGGQGGTSFGQHGRRDHDPQRCDRCRERTDEATDAVRDYGRQAVRPRHVTGVNFRRQGDPKSAVGEAVLVLRMRQDFFQTKLESYLNELSSSYALDQARIARIADELRAEAATVITQMVPSARVVDHVLPGFPALGQREPASAPTIVAALASMQQALEDILQRWTCC